MADKLVPSADDTGAVRRFVDMGRGDWAEQVMVGGGPAGGGAAGYPGGAVPVASSSIGAAATVTATLPAAVGKTTYITGLQVSAGGATAGSLNGASLTGVLGGAMNFAVPVPTGAQLATPQIAVTFNPPLPASAVNTAIQLSMPSLGAGNAVAAVSVQGFQL
ncbi:hypothetical protein [Variovorax sp. GT1P44]|uniref:hypothetical protein n=1 Tax=Variovorax sp. GT1P44 TaxID=3443742 RepID=UPI003F482548